MLPVSQQPPRTVETTIRRATEPNQVAIRAMMRGERLNPTNIDWRRFLVAVDADGMVGAVRLRRHADGQGVAV